MMTSNIFTMDLRTLSGVMLFWWTCTIGFARENESAPFVDYPEPIVDYLQRIQEGKQSHAFDASQDFASWQRDARRALEDADHQLPSEHDQAAHQAWGRPETKVVRKIP